MTSDQLRLMLSDLVNSFKKTDCLVRKLNIAKKHIQLQKRYISLLEYDISQGIPDNEIWVNIKKYEGIYQLSNYGNIRTLEGFFIKKRRGGKLEMAVYKEEKSRTLRKDKNGYLRISLWENETVEWCICHRLVAMYFVPNPNNYPVVMHLDNNPSNSFFKNLRWGTQKMNIQQSIADGRWRFGGKNNKTVLSEIQIPEIRRLLNEGIPRRQIAKQYNVSKGAIENIRKGLTWKNY